ncbi:MAG: protein kinase domain-containing protein [Mycobacteriales bacterium]
MELADLLLQVHPGNGQVANFVTAAIAVLPRSVSEEASALRLITLVEEGVAEYGPHPGRRLVRDIARFVTEAEPEELASFGMVATAEGALAVMVCGAVEAHVTVGPTGSVVLAGTDAALWLDRMVHDDVDTLTVLPSGESAPLVDPRHELRLGVVPGCGMTLVRRAAARQVPQPVPQAQPVPEAQPERAPDAFASIVLAAPGLRTERAPLPVAGEPEAASPPSGRHYLVEADGTSVPLDRDLVLGREPDGSPDVAAGQARPVVLADPNRTVSRIHARISVTGDGVAIRDLGSANGTRVAQGGQSEWTVLAPEQPVPLLPGDRLLIGPHELTYTVELPAALPDSAPALPAEPTGQPLAALHPVERTPGPAGGIADYVFVRSLGQGNQGEFFLAIPPTRLGLDAEYVAVKVLIGETSDDTFRRATRELRAFASVESPYLIKVYDAGQDAGRFFYCMAYFPRGALAAPAAPLTPSEVKRAVAEAARAAHALHEGGIVHQGIKPKNILLGEDHAYLSDLGLAQLLAPGQTVTGLGPIGEVEYLDPSILLGKRGSRATDIFSLGATLHRALTGTSVYGELPSQPLLAIRTVLSRRPAVSPALLPAEAQVVTSCFAEDPADRPPTAEALADQIEQLID